VAPEMPCGCGGGRAPQGNQSAVQLRRSIQNSLDKLNSLKRDSERAVELARKRTGKASAFAASASSAPPTASPTPAQPSGYSAVPSARRFIR
jgi:hypothetical protein